MKHSDLPLALQYVSGSRSYKDCPEIGRALARARLNLSSIRDDVLSRQTEAKIYTSDLSKAYIRGRRDLALKFAQKDEEGHPIPDSKGGVRLKNPVAFELALREYGESHPDELDAFETEEAAFREWLASEVTYSRTKVRESQLPADATADELWAMYVLLDVVEEASIV